MRQMLALSMLTIFLFAAPAMAEEAVATDEQTAADTQENRRPRILNMSLALQLDSTLSEDSSRDYYDVAMGARLRAQMFDRLTVDLSLGIFRVDMDLFHPEGAAFDASLEVPWRGTIGGGARMVLYRWPHVDVSLFAEIYFPIGGGEATIHSLSFYDDLAILGLVDIRDIKNWVTVRHCWYRAEFGVTVRGTIGRWRPFIDVKYVHLSGRLELGLVPELESFASLLDAGIAASYDASFMYPYYALGFEVELGHGVEIEVRVAASPTVDGGWAFVGRAVLEIPLTPQPRCNWSH